jgi:hypothetical protein
MPFQRPERENASQDFCANLVHTRRTANTILEDAATKGQLRVQAEIIIHYRFVHQAIFSTSSQLWPSQNPSLSA